MVVRLVRPPKLAGFHGYRWTVRLDLRSGVPPMRLAAGCSPVSATPGLMLLAIWVSTSL